jgi:hypothetical protein
MMFRRRRGLVGHVWPPFRPWAKSPLQIGARQDLQHANRLMENGDFVKAAILYEKLARRVHDIGRPRQAAHLYVQSARARWLANQVNEGLENLKQGLSIFSQAGLWEPFERVSARALEELRQQNQPSAVQELTSWLETIRQSRPSTVMPAELEKSVQHSLPVKCPSCGAAIRSEEVEWIDEIHAVCNYCGSTLAAV